MHALLGFFRFVRCAEFGAVRKKPAKPLQLNLVRNKFDSISLLRLLRNKSESVLALVTNKSGITVKPEWHKNVFEQSE